MKTQHLDYSMISHLLQHAETFAKNLPQSLGARTAGTAIILTFMADATLPADIDKYRKENIDKYAKQAYKKILSGQNEIDLFLMDIRLVFSTLFWDGKEMSEVEFEYCMNDLLLLTNPGA